MLISVYKMIQRVEGESPSGTPAKNWHCVVGGSQPTSLFIWWVHGTAL